MEGDPPTHLSLDRDLRTCYVKFESWRLGLGLSPPHVIELPSPVYMPEVCDTDYVHARNSALFNAVTPRPSDGGAWVFLQDQGGATELHTLTSDCPPTINRIYSLPPGAEMPLVEPALMPTVVEVSTADGAAAPRHLLASSGQGDLHLILTDSESGSAAAISSTPVHPLRPHAPLQGVRPFQLLAAMRCSDGAMLALIWAVARGTADRLSQCEVHALTLQEQSGGALGVQGVQLVQRSALPPFGVMCDAASGGVLLALDPLDPLLDSVDRVEEDVEGENVNRNENEGDDDDVSPRTLAAAAARLAHLTSEELLTEADLPGNQYADVFKESGPDGAGAMGAEPACTLLALRWRSGGSGGGGLVPSGSIICQSQRLLSCQKVPQEGINPAKLRLTLTDDVDAAVMEAAPAVASTGEAGGDKGQIVGDFCLEHIDSIPALAYVAAGKLQRKFLLTAGVGATAATGEAGVAAVLVEARQHVYMYRHVAGGQAHGEQAVVDTGLGDEAAGVVGAALGGGARPHLLVLGRERLLCYPLCE